MWKATRGALLLATTGLALAYLAVVAVAGAADAILDDGPLNPWGEE